MTLSQTAPSVGARSKCRRSRAGCTQPAADADIEGTTHGPARLAVGVVGDCLARLAHLVAVDAQIVIAARQDSARFGSQAWPTMVALGLADAMLTVVAVFSFLFDQTGTGVLWSFCWCC